MDVEGSRAGCAFFRLFFSPYACLHVFFPDIPVECVSLIVLTCEFHETADLWVSFYRFFIIREGHCVELLRAKIFQIRF